MSGGPKALLIICAKFQVDRSRNQAHMLGSTILNNVLLFLPVPWLNRKSKLSCRTCPEDLRPSCSCIPSFKSIGQGIKHICLEAQFRIMFYCSFRFHGFTGSQNLAPEDVQRT